MSVMTWNAPTNRAYVNGIDKVGLYVQDNTGEYPLGVPWEGVQSIVQSPEGGEATDLYAMNIHYASIYSAIKVKGKITALTFPPEFNQCDGTLEVAPGVLAAHQEKKSFGLVYRTNDGNAAAGPEAGYTYHIIYGCRAMPVELSAETTGETTDATPYEWDFDALPQAITGFKPTPVFTIKPEALTPAALTWFLEAVYGTATEAPYLPLPDEIATVANTP